MYIIEAGGSMPIFVHRTDFEEVLLKYMCHLKAFLNPAVQSVSALCIFLVSGRKGLCTKNAVCDCIMNGHVISKGIKFRNTITIHCMHFVAAC